MNWQIIKKDFIRNKTINLALLLFIMFSAALAVLSVLMAVQTITSISELYKKAQPPHFLQMHKGEIDQQKIDEFMSGYQGITDWQTVSMIDIYGDNLTVYGNGGAYILSSCRLDIGLVRQNKTKDLLLNSEHEKVLVSEGEIGIPVLLKEMYGLDIGDHVLLTTDQIQKEFVIKEFVLDAQMNSPLVSSTRILLSDEDFEFLSGKAGENEYLIETYFHDSKEASDFKTAYENAGLPQNGQAVTYTMIFLLSAFTDIVTVFVLLLVSMLLIFASMICVRFTILAALEEEITEIGTMKAIGLPFEDIRNLYLQKYRALAAAGAASGYGLALLTSGVLTKHISTTFGNMRLSALAAALSLAAAAFIYIMICFYCKKVLSKIRMLTVVDALIHRKGFGSDKAHARDGLYRSARMPLNWLLGIREVLYQFGDWIIVFSVVLISVMMILVPVNLVNTIEAPDFITYMGSSLEDVLIEVEAGESLETNYEKVKQILESDQSIENYYEYKTVRIQTADHDQKRLNIDIDCGDHAGNALKYLAGKAPEGKYEIALSYLNANEIGKTSGDAIDLFINGNRHAYMISGIYQDVTSGGYTAKSKYDFPGSKANRYAFSVDLKDQVDVEDKAAAWSNILGAGVSADPMEEFIAQTLGGVVKQLRRTLFFIILIGAGLAVLITILFMKLRLAKDLSEIAVLKAIGFSVLDIKKQYMIKIGLVSASGLLAGIIITDVLGEKIVNSALSLSGMGIKNVEFIANPRIGYGIFPLCMLALILAATWIVVRITRIYHIVSLIKE